MLEIADLGKVGGVNDEQSREGAYQRGGEHKEPEDHPSHQPGSRDLQRGKF